MSAPSPLSVVIVDDDEFVAQSLRTILEARGSVRVAALGTKGAEAAALFNEHHPRHHAPRHPHARSVGPGRR